MQVRDGLLLTPDRRSHASYFSTPSKTWKTALRMVLLTSYLTREPRSSAKSSRTNGAPTVSSTVSFLLSYCARSLNISYAVLEHGSDNHRQMTLEHLISGLLEFSTNEQGAKSVTKALKEGGKDTVDKFIKRMCEPAKGYAHILSLSPCFEDGLIYNPALGGP